MPKLIEENRYYSLIKSYRDIFKTEQIFYMDFNDIGGNPNILCRSIFHFLEIDDSFVPFSSEKKINKSISPKYPFVSHLTKLSAKFLRYFQLYRILTFAKRSEAIKNLLFKDFDIKTNIDFSDHIKQRLKKEFEPDIINLEKLIRKDLSRWKLT
jgi:hypothetical protein